jgi:hypothetical protein
MYTTFFVQVSKFTNDSKGQAWCPQRWAAAAIWAIRNPDAYRTLVLHLGWLIAADLEWVQKSLDQALT